MMHHLRAQRADLLVREAEHPDEEGPVAEVDDGTGEGFVERRVGGAEAPQTGAGAEGFGEGRA